MAMHDYFRDCNKLVMSKISDSVGGFKVQERIDSQVFQGLAVSRNRSNQNIGSQRDYEVEQFVFHCDLDVSIAKGDKVRYTDVDGSYKYLLIKSNAIYNTHMMRSENDWKTYIAETYLPVNLVV